jgi:hypothetical protein
LKRKGIAGLSADVLERTRTFYVLYPQIGEKISATVSRKLALPVRTTLGALAPPTTKELETTSAAEIPATVSRKSKTAPLPTPLSVEKLLSLSWSHFTELIRLDDPWRRAFYENECLLGAWSVRQLQRQISSQLYERTA